MTGVIGGPVVYPDPYPHGTRCTKEEDMTRQSERDSADINLTIKKYNLQPLELSIGWSGRIGQYADISAAPTFQEAWNRIRKGEEVFMELPPEIRAKFNNSHIEMLDAWDQGEKQEVFEEIGWLQRKPAERPADKPVEAAAETP